MALRLLEEKYTQCVNYLVDCNILTEKVNDRLTIMRFFKINRLRELLVPHYGKSFVEKFKIVWDLGWKENPVMTTAVATLPLVLLYTIYFINFGKRDNWVRKYNKHITIYRSDDPRVKHIRHDSVIDN